MDNNPPDHTTASQALLDMHTASSLLFQLLPQLLDARVVITRPFGGGVTVKRQCTRIDSLVADTALIHRPFDITSPSKRNTASPSSDSSGRRALSWMVLDETTGSLAADRRPRVIIARPSPVSASLCQSLPASTSLCHPLPASAWLCLFPTALATVCAIPRASYKPAAQGVMVSCSCLDKRRPNMQTVGHVLYQTK
jgi:hypothetical protein